MDRDTRKITNITETMVVDSNTGEVTNEVTICYRIAAPQRQ